MARKSKEEKKIDELVAAAFKTHGDRIEFNIMDLSKISKAGRDAAAGGPEAIEQAVIAAIAKYRQS